MSWHGIIFSVEDRLTTHAGGVARYLYNIKVTCTATTATTTVVYRYCAHFALYTSIYSACHTNHTSLVGDESRTTSGGSDLERPLPTF